MSEMLTSPDAPMHALNYMEWALLALYIARHDRSVASSGKEPTPPEVYIAEKPTSLPRRGIPTIFAALLDENDVVNRVLIR